MLDILRLKNAFRGWFSLAVGHLILFSFALAIAAHAAGNVMPKSLDGTSRWADLGLAPVCALVMSFIVLAGREHASIWNKLAMTGHVIAVGLGLIYGAPATMMTYLFLFGMMVAARALIWLGERVFATELGEMIVGYLADAILELRDRYLPPSRNQRLSLRDD